MAQRNEFIMFKVSHSEMLIQPSFFIGKPRDQGGWGRLNKPVLNMTNP